MSSTLDVLIGFLFIRRDNELASAAFYGIRMQYFLGERVKKEEQQTGLKVI